jgi:hypothetical protein
MRDALFNVLTAIIYILAFVGLVGFVCAIGVIVYAVILGFTDAWKGKKALADEGGEDGEPATVAQAVRVPRTRRRPRQSPSVPPLVCPEHGLEHMCRDDEPDQRIDLGNLAEYEAYLSQEDPAWYRRMSRKLGA